MTVLVVDDSLLIRMAMSAILTTGCFDAAAVDGAAAALTWIERHHPDLVITDLVMPQMDGVAFIARLRQAEAMRFVPILAFTGQEEAARVRQARNAGATGWLLKPPVPEQVLAAVRDLVPAGD